MRIPFLLACALPAATLASPAPPPDGAALYRANCAACHGGDGRGASAAATGLPVPVPDFSDCNYATREPRLDWGSIAREGGPLRAFHPMMPAFGDALSDEELAAAVEHVKTFCAQEAWPRGELTFPRAMFTEKAFPEDELVVQSGVALGDEGEVGTKLVYEQRVGARGQVEAIVPVPVKEQPGGGWAAGVGDIALGTKWAVGHDERLGAIFSLAGEVILPTGRDDRGLGKGHVVFEPFASWGQRLPAAFFLHAMAGLEVPVADAANEAFLRVALGRVFRQAPSGRVWAPMVELLGFRELEVGQPVHVDVVPQLHVTLSRRQHLVASVGARLALEDPGARPAQLVAYVLWDWFDGGLTDGW